MQADLMLLSGEALKAAERVRERMDAARCVVDFTVRAVAPGLVVTEMAHRGLLQALFDEILAIEQHGHATWVARNPELASKPFDSTAHNVAQAQATPWNAACVTDATAFIPGQRIYAPRSRAGASPFECLFQAFVYPPYGATCEPGLFADFCGVVGLLPGQGIEVLDWVGDPTTAPERSAWSNYFDAGKEWWGIWCLTIWNPRQRTLSALAASSTD
jgi:hypothetical protein